MENIYQEHNEGVEVEDKPTRTASYFKCGCWTRHCRLEVGVSHETGDLRTKDRLKVLQTEPEPKNRINFLIR